MYEVDDIMSIDFGRSEISVKTLFFDQTNRYDFDDIVLMQSTGLTDKNDKEIFEGDILKFNDEWEEYCYEGYIDGSSYGVNYVEIEKETTCFGFGKTKIPESSLFNLVNDEHLTFKELITDTSFEFEIIGNIHTNPELLEVNS
jgi:uncharacterized phage protein (TIGR01671 family)